MKIDWFRVNADTLISVQSPYGRSYRIRKRGSKYQVLVSTIDSTRLHSIETSLERAKTEVEILIAEVQKKNGK